MISIAFALTTSVTLLLAAVGHLRDTAPLVESLRGYRVALRPRQLAAIIVLATEVLLGVVGLSAVGVGVGGSMVFLAQSGVFVVFTVHASILLRYQPDLPCGCSPSLESVSVWVPIRAALLAAMALVTAIAPAWSELAPSAPETAIAVMAGLSLALVAWSFPGAMAYPQEQI